MKRSFLMAICLSVAAAFAGPYDIDEFNAQDAGTPDDYITAEFGGELKSVPADEVSSLQEGRLVVRQKFEDPFGESETTYQLYQGSAGDLSSMTALSAEGADYSQLVSAKIYESRGMDADKDVEKVYFDGKSVYVPGLTTAVAFIDGSPVTLKGDAPEEAAPVAAAAPAAEEECDEYDPDCEDEDDTSYDVAGNLDQSNEDEDDRYNSANDAAYDASGENATDRFGIADEVRFWSAVGLSAVAAASAVIGVLKHREANKAQDAYDELDAVHSSIYRSISNVCSEKAPNAQKDCIAALSNYDLTGQGYTLNTLNARMKTNQNTHDSYATARNIWFGVTGLTLTAAIVLFVW